MNGLKESIIKEVQINFHKKVNKRKFKKMKENSKSFAGAAPYGYQKKDGLLAKKLSEQKVISEMQRLREEGLSFRKIGNILSEQFIPSKQNGLWYPNVIKAILQREIPIIINDIQDYILLNGDER